MGKLPPYILQDFIPNTLWKFIWNSSASVYWSLVIFGIVGEPSVFLLVLFCDLYYTFAHIVFGGLVAFGWVLFSKCVDSHKFTRTKLKTLTCWFTDLLRFVGLTVVLLESYSCISWLVFVLTFCFVLSAQPNTILCPLWSLGKRTTVTFFDLMEFSKKKWSLKKTIKFKKRDWTVLC